MKFHVIQAIFKRNFFSYFSNPTGYVFICVFVLLSSFAAFWPNEFFNANLANLNQLNGYFPLIMLVFIPAITMSMWAEERRQGTDELLLTIPATDWEVVMGKYLAGVSIFGVSLVFSLICNLSVLSWLGLPDRGLFLSTYFGYFLMGATMISIGMVASFLTGNLTVGFVLGAAFNAPLVFARSAEVIFPPDWAMSVQSWSLHDRFADFGRGIISLSGLAFFLLTIITMLYLSIVLIGRRHWIGGRDESSMGGHYFLRSVALILIAGGGSVIFGQHDLRLDITEERLSSLASGTNKLLAELKPKNPIHIHAYVSPQVPESYVQTRLNLLTVLKELESRAGGNIVVHVYDTEPLSENAEQAEKQFGIVSRSVATRNRGAFKEDEIYLGVACVSGLEQIRIPFLDQGIPVEYELVRSVVTLAQGERKKLGVLRTDVRLFGGFDQMRMTPLQNQELIEELRKQYEVVEVNPDQAITEQYDVLLAVQPSTLGPEQMSHFLEAVRKGQPTAIFEDPLPAIDGSVPGTSAPKVPQQNAMFGGPPPMPKGNINELWELLGVDFSATKVVWQDYNPYRKLSHLPPEFVFVDQGCAEGGRSVFEQTSPITSGLQQISFPFPASISPLNASTMKFTPLVSTGSNTGTVKFEEIMAPSFMGQGGGLNPTRRHLPTGQSYILAAQIQGVPGQGNQQMADEDPADPFLKKPADESAPEKEKAEEAKESAAPESAAATSPQKPAEVNVVLVADIDLMLSLFFALRAQGDDPSAEVSFAMDNVTFVLNVMDQLAGDDRFIELRKRRPKHRILEKIDSMLKNTHDQAWDERQKFERERDEAVKKEQENLNSEIKKLEDRKGVDPQQAAIELQMVSATLQRRLQTKQDQLEKKYEQEKKRIDRDLALKVQSVQDGYKMWAVLLPPLPPMLVGILVFFHRRSRELQGVAKTRLR